MGAALSFDGCTMCNMITTVLFLTTTLMVCDVFCVSIKRGITRFKRLQAVKTDGGRVCGVILGRNCVLTIPKVLVNDVVKAVVDCYLRSGN